MVLARDIVADMHRVVLVHLSGITLDLVFASSPSTRRNHSRERGLEEAFPHQKPLICQRSLGT